MMQGGAGGARGALLVRGGARTPIRERDLGGDGHPARGACGGEQPDAVRALRLTWHGRACRPQELPALVQCLMLTYGHLNKAKAQTGGRGAGDVDVAPETAAPASAAALTPTRRSARVAAAASPAP